jgi:hypothetical protein
MDMTFGTTNVRSLYSAGSLVIVSKELSKYQPEREYTFFYGKGNENHELGTGLYVYNRVEFVSDRMSYIILRGRWCHVIVLNVHALTEDETDDVKDSFYEELEYMFDKFPKYHMKILLGDFNAKVGRNDIFKPTIGNESLHEISNDNGIRLLNFAISKNLRVKNAMLPHRNIYLHLHILGRLQTGKPTIRFTIF